MKNDRKSKLIDLGPESLADALLEIALYSETADELIERMIATPKENVERFKMKLSSLKHSQRFIDWRESAGFVMELTNLLYQKFKSYHATETLQELLDVIGNEKREEVLSKEVVQILKNPTLNKTDITFLIAIGKIDEAEEYILQRAEQFNGDYYSSLLSLAQAMESEDRNLASTLIYRSLLTSILERGYTKAYPHGISYLKKLDKLASAIADWNKFSNHETFKEKIIQAHGRKHSFWSKYGVKK